MPVHRARHQTLINYVEQVVDAAIELRQRNELHALVVLLLDAETPNAILERYMLYVQAAADLGGDDVRSLASQLRGFLLRLQACETTLPRLPAKELTFRVELHSRNVAEGPPFSDKLRTRWVECNVSEGVGDAGDEVGDAGGPVAPIKSLSTPKLSMDLLVQLAEPADGVCYASEAAVHARNA